MNGMNDKELQELTAESEEESAEYEINETKLNEDNNAIPVIPCHSYRS